MITEETEDPMRDVGRDTLREIDIIEKEMEFLHRIKEKEQGIEDERKTNENFSKLFLQEFLLAIYIVICIGSYIVYIENKLQIQDLYSKGQIEGDYMDNLKITIPLWILTINNILSSTIV